MCLCLVVLVCVSMCLTVLVFVVLLVASVLASMRWLLCGDDGSKKTKTRSVLTEKIPAREFISITVLIHSKN